MKAEVVPGDDDRRSAYEVLFRSHYEAVQRFVRARYPNADSSEVMSATFEIAWKRFESIPSNAPRGWLINVARNCSRNNLRSGRRRLANLEALRAASRTQSPYSEPITTTELKSILDAFQRLSSRDQEVLLLAEWEGLRGPDLAAALGTSTSSAGVRLHRARQRLRVHLRNEGGEP